MSADKTCSWLDEGVRDLERLAGMSSPAIARRLAPVLGRIARMNGGDGLRDALERPGSTPFIALIDAAARDLGLADDHRTGLVGRSTILLYVYVRIQDDLVDEEALVDRASVYAMESALSMHLALLAEAGLSSEAWCARSRVMARFAERAAEEIDERADAPAAAPELCGEKFLPMAVPLVALASLASRTALVDELVAYVVHAGTALQMVNDVLNAAEDHAAGRPTPVLRALAAPADTPAQVLRAMLLGHPALDQVLTLARDEARAAELIASRHALTGLATLAAGVQHTIDRTLERAFALMLGVAA